MSVFESSPSPWSVVVTLLLFKVKERLSRRRLSRRRLSRDHPSSYPGEHIDKVWVGDRWIVTPLSSLPLLDQVLLSKQRARALLRILPLDTTNVAELGAASTAVTGMVSNDE